jgi:membrane protein DedA with SNARE-associated domain
MYLAAFLGNSKLDDLLATYGYAIVLAIVAVESIGIPLPGETTLSLAAIYAGATHRLNIGGVIAAATLGAIVGDNLGYLLGRVGGYQLLRRYGHYVRVNERRVKIGRYVFDRHGGKVIFFGRFVSILRTYAAVLAGTMKMDWRKFLVFNTVAVIVWALVVGLAFYYFGSVLKALQTPIDILVGGVALAVLIALLVALRRKEKELGVAAEEAYPGPLD